MDQKKRFEEVKHLIPAHVDKYISIGLNTDGFDEQVFAEGLEECYGFAGLEWHGNVVWVDDPLSCVVAGSLASEIMGKNDSDVYSAVYSAVYLAVRSAVYSAVYSAVGSAVYSDVGSDVIKNKWRNWIGGNMWISWAAYTNFITEIMGIQLPKNSNKKAAAYEKILTNSGWTYPHTHYCIATRPPKTIHTENHQLHNPTGKAIEWRNGHGYYFWKGTRVPEWVIKNPTPQKALQEKNQEIRRCVIESLGWDKLTQKLELVEKNDNPQLGDLYQIPEGIYSDNPLKVLIVLNGSKHPDGQYKKYGITVPGNITSAVQAQNWIDDVPLDTPWACKRT